MDRDSLEREIRNALANATSSLLVSNAAKSLMKLVDKYVESQVLKVRVEALESYRPV